MQTDTKKLLLDWQDEVAKSLVEGFRQLFESSSEVLLEFADAAENNRLQRLFFDAQREFYLKEETIIGDFDHSLRESLQAFTNTTGGNAKPGAETLSLVEVEDYERSLALETIAKRVVGRQMRELHALSQRLSALLGGRPLPPEQVPANPLQIIRIFDPASRKLDVEKEVRLVFYTLFDRYVMSRLGELYADLNRRLVELGILPNIKFDYQRYGASTPGARGRQPGTTEAAGTASGEAADAQDSGPDIGAAAPQRLRPSTPTSAETLAEISSLLMAKRKKQFNEALQTSVPILPTAANVREAIGDVRVLQEAPHPVPIPSGPIGSKVAVDAALLLKVKKALEKQRLIIKSLVGKDRLDRKEEDVIDIVGMLFEAMLNEKLLPNAVKTLLSHLHTRYLKIAVQSVDFLDNTAHPARRLFERMLDAGIRWVREDNLRAGIYPQLQRIVTQILKHETLEDNFFSEKIAELDKAEQKLEQQSSAAEERTLEAERGRARLEQAKAIVKKTIDDIGGASEVSPIVVTFLSTTFADYLTLLLLRSDLDTESQAWGNAYSVGESLVAAAVYAARGQPLGEDMRADLTQRLESSVCSLIPHHEQNIRRVIDALDSAPQKTVADAAAERQTAAPPPPKAQVGTAAQASATEVSTGPVDEQDRKVAEKLMRAAGDWFVLQGKDEKTEQAVKLLWVNPHTTNMLFVDQHGAKVALMPATSVAHKMRDGTVRPMQQETSSFVARSLRRIRRALEDSVNV
ncbi:MAG: DUF1631 family protein [Gammaproteobacteria bacterium]|nr:DUF1631 family protein [Gammaproteobacteria bacterium]MCP5317749.1 DUF1631 family protein [Chromatiaceae bacterium]MCW5585653.1 DUF1631 family protein [Chromatiales bacterium]MCB1816611.1 DUF1631 family protein [Gammaproteobacteria bacterium]MCP5434779.1 DUF1631 family protein [Chromatiaceae bacterium]